MPRSHREQKPGALPFTTPGTPKLSDGVGTALRSSHKLLVYGRKWGLYNYFPFLEEVASATKMAEAGESRIVTLVPSLELEKAEENFILIFNQSYESPLERNYTVLAKENKHLA